MYPAHSLASFKLHCCCKVLEHDRNLDSGMGFFVLFCFWRPQAFSVWAILVSSNLLMLFDLSSWLCSLRHLLWAALGGREKGDLVLWESFPPICIWFQVRQQTNCCLCLKFSAAFHTLARMLPVLSYGSMHKKECRSCPSSQPFSANVGEYLVIDFVCMLSFSPGEATKWGKLGWKCMTGLMGELNLDPRSKWLSVSVSIFLSVEIPLCRDQVQLPVHPDHWWGWSGRVVRSGLETPQKLMVEPG